MCGIVGCVGDPDEVGLGAVENARDLMVHRGPDHAGLMTVGEGHLGFRRLSILDLTVAAHQPMLSPDGQVALVFNGEIYNYRELRRDLKPLRHFRSESDSEVLLNGYLEWGWGELLRRIDGMYAFAIWDARTGVLRCARDRMGKKPLFYARTRRGLAFGSTLNAVAALVPQGRSIDAVALDAYLTYQAVPAPLTIYQGIKQLPPAHQLSFDVGVGWLEIARYWDVSFVPKVHTKEAQVLDDLDHLVRSAVRRRLVSDVPLGAFLSGGVDSSLVVSMMAKEMDRQVEAVVVGFDDPAFDERPHARKVAQKWGVKLHEHVLAADAVRDLPEIVWHYGQPMADVSAVPTYYVAKKAREHVTVVLNGDGGDEVFGGYARPMTARAAQHYRRVLPGWLRRAAASSSEWLNGQSPDALRKLRMLVKAGSAPAVEAFVYDRAFRRLRDVAYSSGLLHDVADAHPDSFYRSAWSRADGEDDVDRMLYGDLTTYLPDQLLSKMDVSTMAHSVEARSPLLDKQLIEYAAQIPTALRLKGYTTKYLLKRLAERYVPREILYRRKQGFVMPAGAWLRTELAPYAEAALLGPTFASRGWIDPTFVRRMFLEHCGGTQNWGEQLWTLFVLEIWARMMIDGTMQREDSLEALL
jgi:asparagine synthase (glutamine-hydrolysing)